jgi:ribose-phosphate pyrophosphokinase
MKNNTNPTKLFAGNSNPGLACKVAKSFKTHLGDLEVNQFSDGEVRVEYNTSVRGQDLFLIQSTCAPTNDNLMQLLVMADAARRSDASKIYAVVPYFGYSRQDRRPGYSRVSITSRLVADMVAAAGIDYLVTVDIHAAQIQGFFSIPTLNVSASPVLTGDIWIRYSNNDMIIVSPDVGGVARARSIAKQLNNANLAIIDKRRPEANVSEVMNIIGDVEGKVCVLVDDMVDTAGTLCKAATALKENGAKKVVAYCTHPVLSGNALDNIRNSVLDELVVTDTIPLTEEAKQISKIRVLSVAGLLADTIYRLDNNESVSENYMD